MFSKKAAYSLLLAISIFISGCWPNGPGSIRGYRYQTTKDILEKAVISVIKSNTNIHRDTVKNYIIDMTNGKRDTIYDNMYNDSVNCLTIKIKVGDIENEYIFRFYGDEKYWKTSSSSEIFIVYANDKAGKGGCERDGIDTKLKKKLTDVFESELVDKVNTQLNLKPLEINNSSEEP